jgi:predicted phosphodiesterase
MSRVAKPGMLELHAGAAVIGGGAQWIQLTGGVTLEKNRPYSEILDRKTEWVKGNRDKFIMSESTNEYEILDQVR